jgi:hypothetical protein
MAIRSDTFGSVRLTGRDAERFVEQVRDSRAPQAAVDAVQRGKVLMEAMRRDGQVTISMGNTTADGTKQRA